MVPAGDVLPVLYSTYDGGTGASITMTDLAVTDIEIYKDGGTTQRASDAGYTLLDTDGRDFDGITGIHGFSIDTGDDTDSGFFAVGSWYHVVVSTITVDSQTVSFIACAFRIMAAEGVAGVPDVNVTHVGDTAQAAGDLATLITTVDTVVDGIQTDLSNGTDGLGAIKTDTAAILVDTNELQGDWTDTGRLDVILDAIKAVTDNLPDSGALTTIDGIVDAIKLETDKIDAAHSEPTGVPAANESPLDKIAYIFMALRNQVDVTATKKTFYDDGGSAEWEKDLTDDGTTYSESEGNAI